MFWQNGEMTDIAQTIANAVPTSLSGHTENKAGIVYLLVHSGQGDIGGQYKALAGTSTEKGQLIPTVIYESTNKAHIEKLRDHLKSKNNRYSDALSIVELD